MVFDLGRALAKKGEFETARLIEFEFKQRARAWRLVAESIGLKADAVAKLVARLDDDAILAELSTTGAGSAEELATTYREASAQARRELIGDLGDPTPYRLL